MSRVLVLSTYELGARPLGCTVPAAVLEGLGHEVRAADLAVEGWPAADVAWAEGAALSVPMHTALRLGLEVLRRLRKERPELPVFLHGLYALGTAESAGGLIGPGDAAVAGEAMGELEGWAERLGNPGRPAAPPRLLRVLGEAGPRRRPPQARAGLPGLERYARLGLGGAERLVGTIETSSGCNHRCRHCPVPVVYEGRSRPVELESVMGDVGALVAEGAEHLHLADPDFLNRPAQALAFARALGSRHPGVTFDATAKVSHLLRHAALLPELAAAGLLFVTSAFESTSDVVLERLDKGHRGADNAAATRLLRRHGVEPRPSLLPFTPWSTAADLVGLFDFVAAEDLVWNVDAVQYSIRLLLPPGSLLLSDPDPVLAACLAGEDPSIPGTAWRALDPALDRCQAELAALAEELAEAEVAAPEAYGELRAATFRHLGRTDPGPPGLAGAAGPPGPERPRLTESWFCCAEPTAGQLSGVGGELAPPRRRPGGSG